MAKIRIYEYLAHNEDVSVPAAVMQMMRDRGYYIAPRNEDELANCIEQYVKHETQNGNYDQAMISLANVHPDRDLILSSVPERKMNADGLNMLDKSAPVFPAITFNTPENHSHASAFTANTAVIAGIFSLALVGIIIIAKS
jgi:hypothetical protein